MNRIDILIISNKFDFTSDYVCIELERRHANYLRINRDDFKYYKIKMNVLTCSMTIAVNGELYQINDKLQESSPN